MSRILRRPMFRGGKVSSYGNGIATGLANGGRVGLANGGMPDKRGLVDGPGGYAGKIKTGMELLNAANRYGKQGLGYLQNMFRAKPSTSKELVPPGYKFSDDFISDFRKNLGVSGGLRDIPGVSPVLNYIAKNPKKSIAGGGLFALSDFTDKLPSGETIARTLLPGKIEDVIFGEKVVEDKDDLTKTLNNLTIGNNLLKQDRGLKRQIKEPDLGMEEQIDIDKEVFSKALGKKKARIADASNMALGFAARAFEDEATTKSALGKFFADESKRPSEASKIDAAAGSAAINKYIKGEISRAEMNKLIELNRTKIADQIAMTKGATSFDDALNNSAKLLQKNKKSLGVIQSAVEQMIENGILAGYVFGGELPEDPKKINVGVIYVKENTSNSSAKDVITINPQTKDLQVIKTIY